VGLLNCEFAFGPGTFYDNIHMLPTAYPDYVRLLIKHLTHPAMNSVSPQLPLRVPDDFVPTHESCVFQPAS
jgi:hypothetical protein